jgi:hypothetical protein
MSTVADDKTKFWFAATITTLVSVLVVMFVGMAIPGLHLAHRHAAYGVSAVGTAGVILALGAGFWLSKRATLRGTALGLFTGGSMAICSLYMLLMGGR